jgi:DNA-binding MarR family transcriptional regulator
VAVSSIRDSNGHGIEVSASEAIRGTSLLARTEGIFAEPAAASVVASLRRAKEEGLLRSRDRIVCVITGTGLKDTKTVTRMARMPKHLIGTEDFAVQPFEIGMTKLKMMQALSEGPAFGYGLWRALSSEKGITTASVYQHLSELERAALVRRSRVVKFRGRERIFYELTRKGSELLKALRKTMG